MHMYVVYTYNYVYINTLKVSKQHFGNVHTPQIFIECIFICMWLFYSMFLSTKDYFYPQNFLVQPHSCLFYNHVQIYFIILCKFYRLYNVNYMFLFYYNF